MGLRSLTEVERGRVARLTGESIDFTLLQPTRTGLNKGILDATAPVRGFLREQGLHDYQLQGQGASAHRVVIEATFLSADDARPSRATLSRPNSKRGDPRIWFKGLPSYADPDDMIAIMANEGQLALLNVTKVDVDDVLDVRCSGPLWDVIKTIGGAATSVASELLAKLRAIAGNGPVRSVMEAQADTAIGRTLETALGIAINSNRAPDYKGIELKSYRRKGRASRENRKTLFAKVPNWEISRFKSSREILDAFGYQRGDDFKLYCTVSALCKNSQGLSLSIDEKRGILNECTDQNGRGAFASWYLQELRSCLLEKHNETFWIGADVQDFGGHDYFAFRNVIHTRKPIPSQFDILLEQGEITMDHLIKRSARGRVSEKGPLFKIDAASLELLFPPSVTYDLT